MKIKRSILLEQGNNFINICGDNCEYIIDEILDFMKEEDIKEYYRHFEMYDRSPEKCKLLNVLFKVQDYIKEIESELEISFRDRIIKDR